MLSSQLRGEITMNKKQKKIAVLHAQTPFMRGGAEAHVENLTRELRYHGYDAELVSMPFKWYPVNTLLDSFLMWRMADLTEANGEKIDLVIALKCPTYLIRHPNKVIWLMHQHRVAYDLIDDKTAFGLNTVNGGKEAAEKIHKMDNIALSETKALFANSENVAKRLKKYNGIEAKALYHPPALMGQYYSGEYGDYILSVGRLDPVKRVDLLIRALPYCDKRIRAIIAGKGPAMEELQKLSRTLKVEDRVDFLGYVPNEEILKLYANALAVCYTPVDEDYGYVTLEAFLSKRPVLTCQDSGGVLEFVSHEENGYISDGSPNELGEYINKLYLDREMVREFGENGFDIVKKITWDHVVDELTKTLR